MNINKRCNAIYVLLSCTTIILFLVACQKGTKQEILSLEQLQTIYHEENLSDESLQNLKKVIPCQNLVVSLSPVLDFHIDWTTFEWNFSKDIQVGMGNCNGVYLIQMINSKNQDEFCFYSMSKKEIVYAVAENGSLLNEICVQTLEAAKNEGYQIMAWVNMGVSSYVPYVWAICQTDLGELVVFKQDTNEFIQYDDFKKGVDNYIKASKKDTIYGGLRWES